MTTTEEPSDFRARQQLHAELSKTLSPASADLLMNSIPPIPLRELATREDLDSRTMLLRGEMSELRGEMRAEFAAVRGEMRAEFAAVRGEAALEFGRLHGSLGEMQRTIGFESRRQAIMLIGLMITLFSINLSVMLAFG